MAHNLALACAAGSGTKFGAVGGCSFERSLGVAKYAKNPPLNLKRKDSARLAQYVVHVVPRLYDTYVEQVYIVQYPHE